MSVKKIKAESSTEVPIVNLQTGDNVKKGSKKGDVVSVDVEGATVIWQDGKFTKEDPNKLDKIQESCFTKYLKMRGVRL